MHAIVSFSNAYSTAENRIKVLGATLSIDDFGTLGTDPDDLSIVRAIIALSRSLKLNVIAEGMGTEAQLALLRSEGCDEHQGYLFARPMDAESVSHLLQRSNLYQRNLSAM